MLSAPDLAWLRAQATELLMDTCTLRRGHDMSVIASGLPCSIAPDTATANPSLSELNMSVMRFILTLPYDSAPLKDARVSHGGHEYVITELLDDQTPLVYKRVRMERAG
jgi:hypothetical protein